MSDPLGLVGPSGNASPIRGPSAQSKNQPQDDAQFKNLLLDNLNRVNALQQDAAQATEDLVSGKRDDIEGVVQAVAKADTAFRSLQAVRNKVIEAYQEIQQMRV